MKRMKSHLTKLSLALLSAAFLLGCQEQGSEPVGPESQGIQLDKKSGNPPVHHHDDDGGGAEGILVDVTLSGGIASAGAQPARLSNDNKTRVEGFSTTFFGELKLMPTASELAACNLETERIIGIYGVHELEVNPTLVQPPGA